MMVSSPNLSGKCAAPGGSTMVPRDGGHEFAISIEKARHQATYRCGAGSNAEAVQTTAAATSDPIRRITTDRVPGNPTTRANCKTRTATTPPYAAPNPAASRLLSGPVAFAAITATKNTCATMRARWTTSSTANCVEKFV